MAASRRLNTPLTELHDLSQADMREVCLDRLRENGWVVAGERLPADDVEALEVLWRTCSSAQLRDLAVHLAVRFAFGPNVRLIAHARREQLLDPDDLADECDRLEAARLDALANATHAPQIEAMRYRGLAAVQRAFLRLLDRDPWRALAGTAQALTSARGHAVAVDALDPTHESTGAWLEAMDIAEAEERAQQLSRTVHYMLEHPPPAGG